MRRIFHALMASLVLALPAFAQSGPLRIEVTEGVIEPMPFAAPQFQAETAGSEDLAAQIARVMAQDLSGTGLFREIPSSAFVSSVASFNDPVAYPDWRAVNAKALITGAVSTSGSQLNVKFRVYDVFSGSELGQGMQFSGTTDGWRRMAHKVADQVYSRLTGEGAYFDSQVVFVSESGPKDQRIKRLSIMDYDGANLRNLTDGGSIVLAPRFSADGNRILFTSYESGFPRINVLDLNSGARRALEAGEGTMSFSPRFSPSGSTVIYSLSRGGNTDIMAMDLASGASRALTDAPSIETAPSYSPDGSRIVFESDRSGSQQLYIMPASGGEATRISFGEGRYAAPVWSPRGDMIAFTKQANGRFHIGVMRTDGSEERLLTASFLDEGPTWAPNGRVVMFTRETQGAGGQSALYSVDVSGRNLRVVPTPGGASDPSWSPLR